MSEPDKNKLIDHFFIGYEDNFNEALAGNKSGFEESIKTSFTDCFIESGPQEVKCVKNDAEFIKNIEKGFEFYKSIGSKSMHIVSKDVKHLDDLHAVVKIKWHYIAIKKDKVETAIDFDIFYILRLEEDQAKIVTYICGDEQKMLAEKGLLPQKESVAK